MQNIRYKRNQIKMKIGFWQGKSEYNPGLIDQVEAEILKLKNELTALSGKK